MLRYLFFVLFAVLFLTHCGSSMYPASFKDAKEITEKFRSSEPGKQLQKWSMDWEWQFRQPITTMPLPAYTSEMLYDYVTIVVKKIHEVIPAELKSAPSELTLENIWKDVRNTPSREANLWYDFYQFLNSFLEEKKSHISSKQGNAYRKLKILHSASRCILLVEAVHPDVDKGLIAYILGRLQADLESLVIY